MQGTNMYLEMEHPQGLPMTGLMGYLLVSFPLLMPALMQKSRRDTRGPPHPCRKNPQGYQ